MDINKLIARPQTHDFFLWFRSLRSITSTVILSKDPLQWEINFYIVRIKNSSWSSPVQTLQGDALCAEEGFIDSFLDESHSFFVGESVPKAVGCQDQKHGIVGFQIENQNVGICDDPFLVLQGIISQSSWSCENSSDPPNPIERHYTSSFVYPRFLPLLKIFWRSESVQVLRRIRRWET